jgi:alpha-tubulin suppressor-like RCC1 family protein
MLYFNLENGSVWTWGYNKYGQLGLNHTENQNAPQLVTALANKKVVSILCGAGHTIVVTGLVTSYFTSLSLF